MFSLRCRNRLVTILAPISELFSPNFTHLAVLALIDCLWPLTTIIVSDRYFTTVSNGKGTVMNGSNDQYMLGYG
jgi:hypothetical protein